MKCALGFIKLHRYAKIGGKESCSRQQKKIELVI